MRVAPRIVRTCAAVLVFLTAATPAVAQDAPLRILIDQSPRAVEYQLSRLTNSELARLERKSDDPRYRPVYVALLTRKGMTREYRDEAVAVLTKLDQTSATRVLMRALAVLPSEDRETAEVLQRLIVSQPAEVLRLDRTAFTQAVAEVTSPQNVLQASYAALLLADANPKAIWQMAQSNGQLGALLSSVRVLPPSAADVVGKDVFSLIAALVAGAPDPATRAQAFSALGATVRDAAVFDLLATEVLKGTDEGSRAAALQSLEALPPETWTPTSVEPLARAVVAFVAANPPARRTEPALVDAMHFGERLAAALPDDRRRAVRRDLAALGVRVVRIEPIPEALTFNTKWFAVQAGSLVQIVLANVDTMPHNLVVGAPGSVEAIGTAGGAMSMPTDPAVKAFVPEMPAVLFSTPLVQPGETFRLGFRAPKEPGEYIYVCTFPGHWVRMYGVMLVVSDRDAFEANPSAPNDPLTRKPFD